MRLATASSQIPHANFSQKASCQATITPLPRPSRLPHMSLKLRTSESMICAAISLSLFSAQRETAKQTKWIDFNRELCKRMCKMKMLLFVFLTLIFFAFQTKNPPRCRGSEVGSTLTCLGPNWRQRQISLERSTFIYYGISVLCSDMKQKAKELSNLNPCQHIQIQCFSTEACSCDAST